MNSTLKDLIEAGKSVTGIEGYYMLETNSEEDIVVPVTVKGIKADGCTLQVIAEVRGGFGQLTVCPSDFLCMEEIEAYRALRERKKEARDTLRKLRGGFTVSQRRRNLLHYIATNIEPKQDLYKILLDELQDTGGSPLKKLTAREVERFGTLAVSLVYDIDAEEL